MLTLKPKRFLEETRPWEPILLVDISGFHELGIVFQIQVKSDASAAVGIAMRRGLGKVRHIDVSQLWLQEKIALNQD